MSARRRQFSPRRVRRHPCRAGRASGRRHRSCRRAVDGAGSEVDLDIEDRQTTRLSTKNTRAPEGAIQCSILRRRPGRGWRSAPSRSARYQFLHGLRSVRVSWRLTCALRLGQRLRIEHGDGQRVVAEVFLRHCLHFFGGDAADLLQQLVDVAPVEAGAPRAGQSPWPAPS